MNDRAAMDHLSSFIHYLQFEKRLSAHTVLAYRKDLEQFFAFLEETLASPAQAAGVTFRHVRSWVVDLLSQGRSPRTIQRKLSTLKAYFSFLLKRGVVARNPMLKVAIPKTGKRLPATVADGALERLLDGSHFGEDFIGWRDRLLLEILYNTGMRRSELIALRLDDIYPDRRLLKVRGKGRKERLIPYGQSMEQALAGYLRQRQEAFAGTQESTLLLTQKGKPLYPKLVYLVVRQYLSLVTTAEQRSPHVLRHSFATHLSDQGADLNAIKELLGHASLAATQIYTHNSMEKLRRVYRQAHPKGRSGG